MDARQLKDAASEFFVKGRFAKAAEAYLSLSKAEPKEPQHLIKLGDSYRRDGRKELAVGAYRGAVEAYAVLGVMIKAIAACKLILEIDPNQKEAQEALARLCAKRYVKRADVLIPPVHAPPAARLDPHHIEPIELSDDDGELEIEGQEPSKKAGRPPPPKPAPPPRVPEPKHAPEALDFDQDPPPPPRPPPLPEISEPQEISLDVDLSGPTSLPQPPLPPPPPPPAEPSRRRRGDAIQIGSTPEDPEAIDLGLAIAASAVSAGRGHGSEDDNIIEELEPVEDELPPGVLVAAETTGEREVIRVAESALERPSTQMARILTKANRQSDEVEIFSVTAAERPSAKAVADPPLALGGASSLGGYFKPAPAPAVIDAGQTTTPQRKSSTVPDILDLPETTEGAAIFIPSADVDQRSVPLFSELPRDAFLDLLERISFRRVATGDVILHEGDEGKSIFVLASGRMKVVKSNGTNPPLQLAVLEEGAFFGEMALLNGSPRVASVIALEDSEILEITETILKALTAKHPSVGQSLKKFYRQRLLQNVMAISPLFRAFDKADRRFLVEKFKLREIRASEAIITEGQPPEGLYVVMHGAALVEKKDPKTGRTVPLALLKEGDVFGEMSLLTRKPAGASVIAKRRTLILRLPKPTFDELMFTHPAVLEVVSELSDQRTKVNELILSGKVEAPHEALAFL